MSQSQKVSGLQQEVNVGADGGKSQQDEKQKPEREQSGHSLSLQMWLSFFETLRHLYLKVNKKKGKNLFICTWMARCVSCRRSALMDKAVNISCINTDFFLQPCSFSWCVTGFAHVSNKNKQKRVVSTEKTIKQLLAAKSFPFKLQRENGKIKTWLQWLIHTPAGKPCSGKVPAQEVRIFYKWMLKGNMSRRCQRWRFFFHFSQHACSPSARHRCVLPHTVYPQPSLPMGWEQRGLKGIWAVVLEMIGTFVIQTVCRSLSGSKKKVLV